MPTSPCPRAVADTVLGTCILLHMEHIVLGWVLLLGTWTGAWAGGRKLSAMKEVAMDMAPSSFDDQYQGCIDLMEAELEELNRTEFTNDIYAEGWRRAAAEWQSRWGRAARPPALRRDQATAMMAYMLEGNLYHQFNNATLTAGRSRQHYLRSYPFKALHFLLSRALHTLWESQPQRCHDVYRGVKGTRFTAQQGMMVRFGQFTSSSLRKKVAESFGQDTFFSVETCYGVPIKEFSTFPGEDEVLIPPFEQFRVTNSTYTEGRSFIQLRSQGKSSTYNCEFVKGKGCSAPEWGAWVDRGHRGPGVWGGCAGCAPGEVGSSANGEPKGDLRPGHTHGCSPAAQRRGCSAVGSRLCHGPAALSISLQRKGARGGHALSVQVRAAPCPTAPGPGWAPLAAPHSH